MKSVAALTGLAALAAAVPDHFQSVSSVLCTDAPAQTVTVTANNCGASGSGSGSMMTVTETVYSTIGSSIASISTATTSSSTSIPPPPTASGTTHNIEVGAFLDASAPGGKVFQFRPNNITAALGDVVNFNMLGASHSVTQSQFANPCLKNGNFDTGLLPNPTNTTDSIIRSFTVNETTPLWFYCKQTDEVSHCGTGMVFGINPKSNLQMEQFIAMAIAQNGTMAAKNTTSAVSSAALSTASSVPKTGPRPTGMRFRH